jgi:hypothetical protein
MAFAPVVICSFAIGADREITAKNGAIIDEAKIAVKFAEPELWVVPPHGGTIGSINEVRPWRSKHAIKSTAR